jgi:hypothetical protein
VDRITSQIHSRPSILSRDLEQTSTEGMRSNCTRGQLAMNDKTWFWPRARLSGLQKPSGQYCPGPIIRINPRWFQLHISQNIKISYNVNKSIFLNLIQFIIFLQQQWRELQS